MLAGNDNKMVYGVDLGTTHFMHAILIVQDVFEMDLASSTMHTDDTEWLQNFEIWIGDNSDYWLNEKCPGGPFM